MNSDKQSFEQNMAAVKDILDEDGATSTSGGDGALDAATFLFFAALALALNLFQAWFRLGLQPPFRGFFECIPVAAALMALFFAARARGLALVVASLAALAASGWMLSTALGNSAPVASAPAAPVAVAAAPGKPAPVLDRGAQPEVNGGVARHEAVGRDEGHRSHFEAEGSLITSHGIPILMQTQTAGGFTPQQRAEAIAGRLNQMASEEGFKAGDIVVHRVNGAYTVYCSSPQGGSPGHVLATVDYTTAAQFGFGNDPAWLAFWWRDVLRDHTLIVLGDAPIYTTPYIQSLQRLYALCQRERKGVPSQESFDKALATMSPTERDALQSLYIRVPSVYRPLENADTGSAP